MTDEELIIECKKGLGLSLDPNPLIDGTIKQKVLAVKSFMIGSGVKAEKLQDDLAVGTIVIGVTDLWNLKTGEIKFSPVFFTLSTQLAVG